MQVLFSLKKILIRIIFTVGLFQVIPIAITSAQIVTILSIDDPDNVMMIKEFGGLITSVNDTISIQMVTPEDQRNKAYQSLDIQVGDIIRMVNGQSLSSVKLLKDIYENAAIGDDIKLGVYRDKKMKLIKFKKANPDKLPSNINISMSNENDNSMISNVLVAGIMMILSNEQLVVEQIIDEFIPKIDGHMPQKGDVVIKLQGNEFESSAKFNEIYRQIKTGEIVNLTVLHDGSEVKSSFRKPEEQIHQRIIQKTG